MRIHAIVYTTNEKPTTPRLDDAWDAVTAEANPSGVRYSLGDLLTTESTHQAAIVVVEVPDEALLECLVRSVPTLPGTLGESRAR